MTDTQSSTVSILREDLALLVEPASHKERISIRRHEAMFKLRAILARPAEQQYEPVAWLNEATGHVTTSPVVVMDWDDEKERVQSLYRRPAAQVVKLLDVDQLSNIIRQVDGNHSLGAGALAEKILDAVSNLNGIKP